MDLVLDQIKTVHIKLDRLNTKGCAKGDAQAETIKALDERTAKMEGWITKLALIVAAAAGSGAGLAKILEKLWQ